MLTYSRERVFRGAPLDNENNLLVWYTFDDGLTATDRSGRGNNAPATGSPSPASSSVIGGGVNVSGTNYFTLGTWANISVFTYAAWVFVTGSGARAIMATAATNLGPEWRINATNKLELLKQQSASIGASTASVGASELTHVATTYDASGNYAHYINGLLSGSGTSLQTFSFAAQAIGKANNGENWSGAIEDLRIYSRILNAVEINALANQGRAFNQFYSEGELPVLASVAAAGFFSRYYYDMPAGNRMVA